MKATDVMVREVVAAGPDSAVSDAVKLLVEHDVSALPVVDQDRHIVGILSEADLMRREEIGTEKHRPWWLEAVVPAASLAGEFAKSHGRKVGEVMSESIVTVGEDASLAEIATLFERHRIKRVPVVRDGKLVGIVSRANLIQAIASAKAPPSDAHETDRAIRLDLLARLAEQRWTDFGSRNIIVIDGSVHIWGLVGSPQERRALVALAEGVPGVKSVIDEMIPAY
jgi:CBS-domain-containing membrane protein